MGGYSVINLAGKSILIRVDGSHAIGLGHIYRMKTLSMALQEAGDHVAFLTQADEAANELFETTGLSCHIFQPDSYDLALKEAIKKERPVLIIQDILETSAESMEHLRRLSPAKIINFDDVGAGLTMADAVINSMVFHWNKYKISEIRTRLFEGPQYMILQPEIGEYVHLDKRIPDKAENILLAFGGTDTHYVTERVLVAINNIDVELNVKINMGPGSWLTPRLEQAAKISAHHIKLIRFAPNLLKEFYQADMVICSGGIMLYELAALGVPSASVATELHEVYNVDYWSGVGTTISLGWEKTLSLSQVSAAIGGLLYDRQQRAKMSRSGKVTIDDLGLTRVLNIIGEYCNETSLHPPA